MSHPLDLLIRTLATASGRSTPARARTKPPDIEGTAAAIDGLIGTLERHLPGCGRSDVLDAATAKGGFAGPDRVASHIACYFKKYALSAIGVANARLPSPAALA